MSVYIKGIELPERVQVLELHHDGKVFTRKGYLVGEAIELPDKHGDLIDRDELRAEFPEPIDIIDPQQALVHITGVWAEIDCADAVIEAEGG